MTGVWWELPPPPTPSLAGMVGPFKLSSEQGFVSTQNLCPMDLWLAWPILTHHHHHHHQPPLHRPPWGRVSWLLLRLLLSLLSVRFLATWSCFPTLIWVSWIFFGLSLWECSPEPFQTDKSVSWRHTLPIFRELGFAPIGGKFPPITAPHVLCTVKNKNLKYFQNFFSYSCFYILKLFSCEKRFLNSYYDMLWTIFHLFQYWNFTTYFNVRTSEEKKSKKWLWIFF
jgi:hypothetical protein